MQPDNSPACSPRATPGMGAPHLSAGSQQNRKLGASRLWSLLPGEPLALTSDNIVSGSPKAGTKAKFFTKGCNLTHHPRHGPSFSLSTYCVPGITRQGPTHADPSLGAHAHGRNTPARTFSPRHSAEGQAHCLPTEL